MLSWPLAIEGRGRNTIPRLLTEPVSGLLLIHRYRSSALGQLGGWAAYRVFSLCLAKTLPCTLVTIPWSRFQTASYSDGQWYKCLEFCSLVGNNEMQLAASVDSTHDLDLFDATGCASCDHQYICCVSAKGHDLGSQDPMGSLGLVLFNRSPTQRGYGVSWRSDRFPASGEMKGPQRQSEEDLHTGVIIFPMKATIVGEFSTTNGFHAV